MDNLLEKVKANLILEHKEDDVLIERLIDVAINYAESYQHLIEKTYIQRQMPPSTEHAIIMLASHLYESRDGSTGGFFGDNTGASGQVWNTVNTLLRLDRVWKV